MKFIFKFSTSHIGVRGEAQEVLWLSVPSSKYHLNNSKTGALSRPAETTDLLPEVFIKGGTDV